MKTYIQKSKFQYRNNKLHTTIYLQRINIHNTKKNKTMKKQHNTPKKISPIVTGSAIVYFGKAGNQQAQFGPPAKTRFEIRALATAPTAEYSWYLCLFCATRAQIYSRTHITSSAGIRAGIKRKLPVGGVRNQVLLRRPLNRRHSFCMCSCVSK